MYYFRQLTPEDLSARSLILSLLSSAGSRQQSIGELIRAGDLFNIEPSTIRVAVTRLQKDGFLESVSRGVYRPGPKVKRLIQRLQSWKEAASRTHDWNGDWLAVMTSHLGRTDRKQVRARERALRLNGYRLTDLGIWVRPANLVSPLQAHRKDMVAIGLDKDAMVTQLTDIAVHPPQKWQRLWSAGKLNASYAAALDAMRASRARLPGLDLPEAAFETLMVGQSVIQTINFDPLLPAEICNADLFEDMVEGMIAYNDIGVALWRDYQAGA